MLLGDRIANNFSLNRFVARANYVARAHTCWWPFARPCSWFSSRGFRLPSPGSATVSENGNGNGNVASALCNVSVDLYLSFSFNHPPPLSLRFSHLHNPNPYRPIVWHDSQPPHVYMHVRAEDYGWDSVRSTCVIFRPANSAFTLRVEELAKV